MTRRRSKRAAPPADRPLAPGDQVRVVSVGRLFARHCVATVVSTFDPPAADWYLVLLRHAGDWWLWPLERDEMERIPRRRRRGRFASTFCGSCRQELPEDDCEDYCWRCRALRARRYWEASDKFVRRVRDVWRDWQCGLSGSPAVL